MDKRKIAKIISVICMAIIICIQVISIIRNILSISRFASLSEPVAWTWLVPLFIITVIHIGLLIAVYSGYKKDKKYGVICGIIEGIILIMQSMVLFKIIGIALLIISILSFNELGKGNAIKENKKEIIQDKNTKESKRSSANIFIIVLFVIVIIFGILMWNKIKNPKSSETQNSNNGSPYLLDEQEKASENYYNQGKKDNEAMEQFKNSNAESPYLSDEQEKASENYYNQGKKDNEAMEQFKNSNAESPYLSDEQEKAFENYYNQGKKDKETMDKLKDFLNKYEY